MRNTLVIARHTALELLRNRILYAIVLFALMVVLGAESLSHHQRELQVKLVKDLSFGAISLFMLFICLFVTMEQVPAEIERRTVYFLLTRPVYRLEFLMGKFVGVSSILMLTLVLLGGLLLMVLGFSRQYFDLPLLVGLLLLGAKTIVLCAMVTCFSTFMTNIVSVSMALFVYFFGHVSGMISHGLEMADRGVLMKIVETMQFFLPNFQLFDLQDAVVVGAHVEVGTIALLLGYALLFCINFMLIGHIAFHDKDL